MKISLHGRNASRQPGLLNTEAAEDEDLPELRCKPARALDRLEGECFVGTWRRWRWRQRHIALASGVCVAACICLVARRQLNVSSSGSSGGERFRLQRPQGLFDATTRPVRDISAPCEVGDAIVAIWAGDGRFYPGTVDSVHMNRGTITVNWNGGASSLRTVASRFVKKGSTSCLEAQKQFFKDEQGEDKMRGTSHAEEDIRPKSNITSGTFIHVHSQPQRRHKKEDTPVRRCCKGPDAFVDNSTCRACDAKQTTEEFCLIDENFKVIGCDGWCGDFDDGVDFPGLDLYTLENISSPEECCKRCRWDHRCKVWSWGKPTAVDHFARNRCFLKDDQELKITYNPDAVSGYPGKDTQTFQVKNRHGLCLGTSPDLDAKAIVDTCRDVYSTTDRRYRSQQWTYSRRNRTISRGDLCLGSPDVSPENGGLVHLRPCMGLQGQHWTYDGVAGLVKNKADYCLDAPKRHTSGSTVGLWPCKVTNLNMQWSFWNSKALGKKTTYAQVWKEEQQSAGIVLPPVGDSLFCFTVMLPLGHELKLMQSMHFNKHGIFACDEAQVFSSQAVDIGSFFTQKVKANFNCKKGGQWGTFMNTPIFQKIWNQVIAAGSFRQHNWIVKVDPDAVFIPARLKAIVKQPVLRIGEVDNGVILHNCKDGLHGPIEVMSRRALEVYGKGYQTCDALPQEDYYLSACMEKLGVETVESKDLLADQGCVPDGVRLEPDWYTCRTAHAAFHPFKSAQKYEECWNNAVYSGSWTLQ